MAHKKVATPRAAKKEASQGKKEVVSGTNFGEFFKFDKVGDKFSGIYTGSHIIPARDGYAEQLVHDVIDNDDVPWTLPGNYDLSAKLAQVPFSEHIYVELIERKDLKGDREFKRFFVEIDENVTLKPVDTISAGTYA